MSIGFGRISASTPCAIPAKLGAETEAFLSWLANERRVSASTHRQALAAMLFLYGKVMGVDLPWMSEIGQPPAPLRAGVEEARAGEESWQSHRDLCRRSRDPVQDGKAEEALQRLRELMGKLKLTVNEEKTRICKVPEGEVDFLGYKFGRMYSAKTGQARLGYREEEHPAHGRERFMR